MKKLAITLSLVLALAIAAAVSLPVLAAETELGTTTISVTILGNTIDVDIDSAGAGMGNATPDEPGEATVGVSAGSNADAWDITLQDKRETPDPVAKGYMQRADAEALENALGVQGPKQQVGDPDDWTWTDLTGDPVILHEASAPGTAKFDVNFKQEIEYTDAAGDYEITVTFVGTTY